jgi:hypothetical protein
LKCNACPLFSHQIDYRRIPRILAENAHYHCHLFDSTSVTFLLFFRLSYLFHPISLFSYAFFYPCLSFVVREKATRGKSAPNQFPLPPGIHGRPAVVERHLIGAQNHSNRTLSRSCCVRHCPYPVLRFRIKLSCGAILRPSSYRNQPLRFFDPT